MENRLTWVGRNGTEVVYNVGSSMVVFLIVPLGVSVFSGCLLSMTVFLFPLTSRVGADDLTRTWPVVDLSHICTLLRVYVSLCACVRVWRVFFCVCVRVWVCLCACALCFGLCFFFASCCASFMVFRCLYRRLDP